MGLHAVMTGYSQDTIEVMYVITKSKSNQIEIFISISNDNNNRYSTYKGNIVIGIYTYTHSYT